jgi:hypothetical protein
LLLCPANENSLTAPSRIKTDKEGESGAGDSANIENVMRMKQHEGQRLCLLAQLELKLESPLEKFQIKSDFALFHHPWVDFM